MSAKTQKQSGGGRKTAEKPRILYFDILRALAPILVVIIHVACRTGANTDFWGTRFRNMHWLHVLCQVCIPIFVMISGALFLDPRRKFDMKKHLRKYVLRIAILFAVWTVIYAVLEYVFAVNGATQDARLGNLFARLFGEHYGHLWFLMMIGLMYLLVPCLRKITESRALTEYFLILGIVFCFALPTLCDSFDMLRMKNVGDNVVASGALRGMSDMFSYLSGKLGLKFVIYFVLGYYLHRYTPSRNWRIAIYVLGILGVAATFTQGLWRARLIEYTGVGADLQNINIGILAYGAALFILVKQLFGRAKKLPRWISFMAKHSFGVYLVHAALVNFVLYRIIAAGSRPIWLLLLCSIPIYLTSLVVAWALSKLPLIKKVVQ